MVNIEEIERVAVMAGKVVMAVYEKDFDVDFKEDESPLTEADLKANEIICRELKSLYSEIPILSEENKQIPYEARKGWNKFWLVDPVDGTKEFIKKNGEFTVNIALIENGNPVLGVVYAPALEDLYSGEIKKGASKNGKPLPLTVNSSPEERLTVVASRSHLSRETEDFIEALKTNTKNIETISKGSSLKLCLVAEGEADYYPRLAPTMEWDTAAAHAVCLGAGKKVYRHDNSEDLTYNKENLLNPWFIVH
ncbi:MAG: 3'(2'),5'-bisphosphate nucleotidase CysQ [Lentisphaeraceae bacterium]|nr:3'(2'),5'-bisphosphate nucleotidase CysQ [Lentisphaeraceae bacterium]